MNAAALDRDAFAPQQPPGMRSGLALAILAHALLILALAWSVHWKASEPEGVVAELWSAMPQIAAPRPSARRPSRRRAPVVEPKPAPPRRRPKPAPPPRVDAQIAIERQARAGATREGRRREEAERRPRRAAQGRGRPSARRRAELEAEREQQRARRGAGREEEARRAGEEGRGAPGGDPRCQPARMMSQAGTSDDPSAAGTAARTSGPSASYAGRIKARIKPNIVLDRAASPATRRDRRGARRARRHHRRQKAREEQRLAGVGRDRAARDRQDRGAAEGRRRPRAAVDDDRLPAARIAARRLPHAVGRSNPHRPWPRKRWSQHVTETSDALDLKEGVFKLADPAKIARSLKASAEHSDRRKSDPYRSAMSMLTFYINRAGHNLPKTQLKRPARRPRTSCR